MPRGHPNCADCGILGDDNDTYTKIRTCFVVADSKFKPKGQFSDVGFCFYCGYKNKNHMIEWSLNNFIQSTQTDLRLDALENNEKKKTTNEKKMNWGKAVAEWNSGQVFRGELYVIPKKGSEFYDEVRELMGVKPTAKAEPIEVEAPKTETPKTKTLTVKDVRTELPIVDTTKEPVPTVSERELAIKRQKKRAYILGQIAELERKFRRQQGQSGGYRAERMGPKLDETRKQINELNEKLKKYPMEFIGDE